MMQVAEFFLSSVDILSNTYLNVLVTSKIIMIIEQLKSGTLIN